MSREFDELKEALSKPATPEAMRGAAEAMRRYNVARLASGHGSKPTLVSLGLNKTYPSDIPLDKIPEQLEKNPEFFELMKRIMTKEK